MSAELGSGCSTPAAHLHQGQSADAGRGDMSRAHGTPPPIPHQSCLDVTALKKFLFPPACPLSSPEPRSRVSQLCTAQQPWLLPPSLSSPVPQVQLSQQRLRSLPDLLSLPELLKQTAGNGKQALETVG